MDFDEYFHLHAITPDAILQAVDRRVGRVGGDFLYLSGSLAESLGNQRSDVDVFLITSRDLSHHQIGPTIPIELKGRSIDLEWRATEFVEAAIQRINQYTATDPRAAIDIGRSTLDFVHRFSVGRPLDGSAKYQDARSRLNRANISRILIHEAIAEAAPLQIDILGAIEAGDWDTAAFVTDRLLGFVVQAILAAHGNTNPSEKWRWRKLRELDNATLPAGLLGGVLAPTAYSYLSRLRMYSTLDSDALIDRANKVVHVANRVLPTCQVQLAGRSLKESIRIDGETALMGEHKEDKRRPTSRVLPPLPLDFGIRFIDGEFHAYRIMGDVDFTVNQLAAELLLGFDGRSSRTQVASRLSMLTDANRATIDDCIDAIFALLRTYGILPREVEQALIDLRILGRAN